MSAAESPDGKGRPGLALRTSERSVLLVADSLPVAEAHARGLERLDYGQVSSGPAKFARRFVQTMAPDAIVIFCGRDRNFDAPGLVRELRGASESLITVVPTADSYAGTIECFVAGADDVARGDISTEELDLRLRAFFRRMGRPAQQPAKLEPEIAIGDIQIDPNTQQVRKGNADVPLSPTEYRLLLTLAQQAGKIVPAQTLISRVWGPEYEGETHYLRLYVRYLRQKLEDDPANPRYIVNRRGTGYAIECERGAKRASVDIGGAKGA